MPSRVPRQIPFVEDTIPFSMTPPVHPIPAFEQLPLRKGDPPHSAWGLWGNGPNSVLGSLNYLTDEVVLQAIKEVRTGDRVGLK